MNIAEVLDLAATHRRIGRYRYFKVGDAGWTLAEVSPNGQTVTDQTLVEAA